MSHLDDEFHPADTDDPYWTETCWFTFAVPERRLSGQLYPFFRTNQGVCAAAAYVWDESGDQPWNVRYAKNFWHLRIPEQPLSDISLPNGIRYRCVEPRHRYDLAYDDPDGDDLHIRLNYTSVARPNYIWAPPIWTSRAATRGPSFWTGRRSTSTPTASVTVPGESGHSSARATAPAATRTPRPAARTASTPSRWTSAPVTSPFTATTCATASGPSWPRPPAPSPNATGGASRPGWRSPEPTRRAAPSRPGAGASTTSPCTSTPTCSPSTP